MTLAEVCFVLFAFFCGSIPFSVWIGRFALNKNIQEYGDKNPGASNVLRAGGMKWGMLALMLDISKGAAPVGMAAQIFGITGLPQVLIAVAPPLGHAFSPFLGFRGGKAIATTFGMWIGLSLWEIPSVAMLMLVFWFMALTSSGWAVMFTMISVLVYMVLTAAPSTWFMVWGINLLLLIYKHRRDLTTRPHLKMSPLLRPVLRRIFSQEFGFDTASSVHHGGADRH